MSQPAIPPLPSSASIAMMIALPIFNDWAAFGELAACMRGQEQYAGTVWNYDRLCDVNRRVIRPGDGRP